MSISFICITCRRDPQYLNRNKNQNVFLVIYLVKGIKIPPSHYSFNPQPKPLQFIAWAVTYAN
jgi:hypothetical protein